jgi:hypothetical protein
MTEATAGVVKSESSFSLYKVVRSEEFKRAKTVLIHCTNGRSFVTSEAGSCRSGDIILGEWSGDKLLALYRARVVDNTVRVGGCIVGFGSVIEVPLSQVTDHR